MDSDSTPEPDDTTEDSASSGDSAGPIGQIGNTGTGDRKTGTPFVLVAYENVSARIHEGVWRKSVSASLFSVIFVSGRKNFKAERGSIKEELPKTNAFPEASEREYPERDSGTQEAFETETYSRFASSVVFGRASERKNDACA